MTFNLTTAVRGADLSHYQQRPSFQQLVDDGISFVYIKAWENDAPDPDFTWNVSQAEKVDMPWFWYPFLRQADTIKTITDCRNFVATPNVPAILDWEASQVPSSDVELWKNELEQQGGRTPMCYHGIWPPGPVTPTIAECPWVLAEYTSGQPRAPAWDGTTAPDWTKEWVIWQNSGSGRLGGLVTPIDLDVLAVSLDMLKVWRDTGIWPLAAPSS